MVIALAFLPSRFNWIIAALAALSITAMLMATAVEPHFPYEYANPLRDFALQSYLRGDFAYDRDAYFGGPAIVDESTAFNLGKLVGLAGPLQLWPLGLLWIGGVWWLAERKGVAMSRRWRIGTISAIGLVFAAPLIDLGCKSLETPPHNGLLGRYYRELRPNGFPPHLERVDPQLDFGSVGELGCLGQHLGEREVEIPVAVCGLRRYGMRAKPRG